MHTCKKRRRKGIKSNFALWVNDVQTLIDPDIFEAESREAIVANKATLSQFAENSQAWVDTYSDTRVLFVLKR